MNFRKDEIISWLKAYYDKFVLVVVLAAVLLSLSILIWSTVRERKALADDHCTRLPMLQSRKAKPLDMTPVCDAIEAVNAPFQLGSWTTRMVVAELRVSCIRCGRPIPINAEMCSFRNCGARQPKVLASDKKDSDFDSMPDEWEKKMGLDPNAEDAAQDADRDGFTNFEEFTAGTHPKDDASAPSSLVKLRILKIARITFPLIFTGTIQVTPTERIFMLRNRQTGKDYSASLGETVEGYKLADFAKKTASGPRTTGFDEEISVLTLRKDGKKFELKAGDRLGAQGEWAASLLYLIDNARLLVKKGDIISLKNNEYKIVDITPQNVIVQDMQSGEQTVISPTEGLQK